MIKSFIVDSTCNNMRLDRWLRNKLGKIPQGLIEKTLRSGKIKINKKKVKSSFKVKTNDKVDIFNFNFKEKIVQKKMTFAPSNEIIKANEEGTSESLRETPRYSGIDHTGFQVHDLKKRPQSYRNRGQNPPINGLYRCIQKYPMHVLIIKLNIRGLMIKS